MKTPPRWKDIVVGLALGYTRQEISQALGESTIAVSNAVKDIRSTASAYEDPAELLGEILGTELDSNLDPSALNEDEDEDEG